MSKESAAEQLERFFLSIRKNKWFNKIITSKRKKESIVCAMIHNEELSLILMDWKKEAYHVSKIFRKDLNTEWFENNRIINHEKIGLYLKELCAEHKLKSKKVTFISEDPRILPRLMTVPKKSTKWIAAYLQKEVKKYVLFSGSKIKLNWKIVDTVEQDGESFYRVFVVAMKADLYKTWVNVFKQAGMYLNGISTHTLALDYALSKVKSKKNRMIVSIEPKQTVTYYIKNGAMMSLHIDPITTENLINHPDTLSYLDSIIKRHQRKLPDCDIYYYCACWIPTQQRLLDKALSSIDVNRLSTEELLQHISYDNSLTYPVESYVAAAGIVEMTADDMLIVDLTQGQPYFDVLLGYFIVTMALAAVVIVSVFMLFYSQTETLNNSIQEVRTELDEIDDQYKHVTVLEKDIDFLENLINKRKEKANNKSRYDAEHFFKTLPTLLNNNVRLEQFRMNAQGSIVLDGHAKGPDDAFTLLQELKKSSYFVNPVIKQVIQNKGESSVGFIINAKLGEASHDE